VRSTRPVLLVLFLAVALLGADRSAAETFVLPAVVRGVPGMNGSFWETEVRILRMSLQQPFVVRRVWVATAEGGFVDDPATAPRWEFPQSPSGYTPRLLQLRGPDLLIGTDAMSGAVAIEVQGSAIVYVRSTNTAGTTTVPLVTRGNGWLTLAPSAPLSGPSTIAWSTEGSAGMPEAFGYRTSVGLVNPSPVGLDVRVRVADLSASYSTPAGGADRRFWSDTTPSEPVSVHLAPWTRLQLDDFYASVIFCYPIGCWPGPSGEVPALILVEPQGGGSYYAYSSMIFNQLNDPEVVMAVPGLPEGIPFQ
jgi:hypothetical protein